MSGCRASRSNALSVLSGVTLRRGRVGYRMSEKEKPSGPLRSGYTTGACATAATKGALLALVHQQPVREAAIRLPRGELATFALHDCTFAPDEGRACVIKDAGDDPDVTDKAEIWAHVRWSEGASVTFRGGAGVGQVTKPGLPISPGEPAINPVPRQMMTEAVREVLEDAGVSGRGVEVEIAVPRGEELARKTFNPRLGIVGGISILGTTGIVVPYSTAAWLASVVQAIDVAVAQGCHELVLSVGARGEHAARRLFALPEVAFVEMGPFFGDALRHATKAGVRRVAVVSMIGKLAKFAAENESVHSSAGGQDFAFLAEAARQAGADEPLRRRIETANTAQEVANLVTTAGVTAFFRVLCERAWRFATRLAGPSLMVEINLIGIEGEVLARVPQEGVHRG